MPPLSNPAGGASLGFRPSQTVPYKSKCLCCIKAQEGNWYIRPFLSCATVYEAFVRSEKLEEIVWKNVHYCRHCGRCAPGRTAVILGREFPHVCYSIQLELHNPDDEALRCAKKLVEFKRAVIGGDRRKGALSWGAAPA